VYAHGPGRLGRHRPSAAISWMARGPACLTALAVLSAAPPSVQARVRQDPGAAAVSVTAADATTWTHLVPDGVDRYLLVGLTVGGAAPVPAVSSLTGNGVSLQPLGSIAHSSGLRVELWGWQDPPIGPQTLELRLAGAASFVAGSVSYADVDRFSPTGPVATGEGDGPVGSVTVVSVQGEQILDVYGSLEEMPTVGQSQTINWSERNTITGASSSRSGSNSVTMSWGHGGTTRSWAQVAVSVRGRSSPVPPEPGAVDAAGPAVDAAGPVADAAGPVADALPAAGADADPLPADARLVVDAPPPDGGSTEADAPGDTAPGAHGDAAMPDASRIVRRQLNLGCACSVERSQDGGSAAALALVILQALLGSRRRWRS
jgi:MYXO-CTERM domain-containing protein